ncbi:MAG: hypothetical protein EHM64_02135 [Ignavibacteriae bacterium]|nr:MAG: hypothetical protein EHM64_02135 [Ignavibacteriota bacterium]
MGWDGGYWRDGSPCADIVSLNDGLELSLYIFRNIREIAGACAMEKELVPLLKENILQRKQFILEFVNKTDPFTLTTRIGPNDKKAVEEELNHLDHLLKKADENTLGQCEVCHESVEAARLEMDYSACVCLEHLSGEERTKLEYDLELSQKVQRALLPNTLPEIKRFEIAAFSQPARIVGGDYFDFLRFQDGTHALAIADVMGKGMPASLLMSNLQASLRIIAPEKLKPADVLERLNHIFCHNIRLTKFVTFFLAQIDEATRTLTYCNAGHNPPLLRHADGSIEWLIPTGAAIGLIEQTEFLQNSVILQQGDRVVLYTDGVVESFNKNEEQFGEERLEQFLHNSAALPTSQVIASLRETLHQFTQTTQPLDDTTVIVLTAV